MQLARGMVASRWANCLGPPSRVGPAVSGRVLVRSAWHSGENGRCPGALSRAGTSWVLSVAVRRLEGRWCMDLGRFCD